MNEAHFLYTRTVGVGGMERVYSGEGPTRSAPFQADEIIGFDFGRRAG